MLTFRVTLEVSSQAMVFGQPGGKLQDLYNKWIDGGKDDADFDKLAEFIENEIEPHDLEFWVEGVELIK